MIGHSLALYSIVVDVMKMGNIVPRAGIEAASLAFQASVLQLHHVGSLNSPLCQWLPVYAAPCLEVSADYYNMDNVLCSILLLLLLLLRLSHVTGLEPFHWPIPVPDKWSFCRSAALFNLHPHKVVFLRKECLLSGYIGFMQKANGILNQPK